MGRRLELQGQQFGRWTVESQSDRRGLSGSVFWNCRCVCGGTKQVSAIALKSGDSRSCGCLFLEVAAQKGRNKRTHGMEGTREYTSWSGMRGRCACKTNPKYPVYGGRGITFCERWDSFEAFYEDMGPAPVGTTLDRIDVNGNYEPGNCRWATSQVQQSNRRNNVYLEVDGKRQTVSQWCKDHGLKTNRVWALAKRNGRDFSAAINHAIKEQKGHESRRA